MDVSAPHHVFGGGIAGDLLVEFGRRPGTESTGRQLAGTIGRSHPAVSRTLDGLVAQGIIRRRSVPPAYLYSLNERHLAASIVIEMARLRFKLVEQLRQAVQSWTLPPEQATLFGSAARGDGSPESDLDILIIRPTDTDPDDSPWRDQLDGLAGDAEAWTGNRVQYLELTAAEAHAATTTPTNALRGAVRDGITLTEAALSTYLRRLARQA